MSNLIFFHEVEEWEWVGLDRSTIVTYSTCRALDEILHMARDAIAMPRRLSSRAPVRYRSPAGVPPIRGPGLIHKVEHELDSLLNLGLN